MPTWHFDDMAFTRTPSVLVEKPQPSPKPTESSPARGLGDQAWVLELNEFESKHSGASSSSTLLELMNKILFLERSI